MRWLDMVADWLRYTLARGIALGIELALDGRLRDVWIAVVAMSNAPVALSMRDADGSWRPASPDEWAAAIVLYADAVRRAAASDPGGERKPAS